MKSRLIVCLIALFLTAGTTYAVSPSGESQPLSPQSRPALFARLPDSMFGPDALCWDQTNRCLYLSVPNFVFDPASTLKAPPCLALVRSDGSVEKLLDFPAVDGVERTGCMGIDFGPDGNLYVCDNQYFFDSNWKSRILRVVFRQGRPTGEVQTVVRGLKVANAILWDGERVFVTDTILDEPGKYGSGGVWLFSSKELLSAGTDTDHPAIQVKQRGDSRLILTADCDDIGRNNNCGADGIAKDKNGIYYFGNYGDGGMFRFRFNADGKIEMQKIHPGGKLFRCVDGICYDRQTDAIYITNSADNAIWSFVPPEWGQPVTFKRLWENDDTDGADGSLDLPCECRVIDDRLIIVNQDVGLGTSAKNQKTDKPYTLSAITIGPRPDFRQKVTVELDGSPVLPNYGTASGIWFFHRGADSSQVLIFGHPETGIDKVPHYRLAAFLKKGSTVRIAMSEKTSGDPKAFSCQVRSLNDKPIRFDWKKITKGDKSEIVLILTAPQEDASALFEHFVKKENGHDVPVSLDVTRRPFDLNPVDVSPDFHPLLAELLIEWDWRMQDGIQTPRESRTFRQALEKRIPQGSALLGDLTEELDGAILKKLKGEWSKIVERFAQMSQPGKTNDSDERWEKLWRDMHQVKRDILVASPFFDTKSLLFVKHAPGVMSHQLTQVYGYAARPGGGLFLLDDPGRSMKSRRLTTALPSGAYMTPEISTDAKKIWFAFCNAPNTPKKWRDPQTMDRRYHIWSINADGTNLKRLTDGPWDDFSPLVLPDDDLVFVSSRRGGFHRCGGGPCYVYTLCKMKPDGSNPHLISFHETNEWDPTLLNDGRIVYTRWDYVDRHAVYYQNLWSTRQDGTDVRAYYGNNTFNPCGIWETKAIPGSNRVMAIAGPHHGLSAGSVIMLDPTVGIDGPEPVTRLTPEVLYPEGEVDLPIIKWSNYAVDFDTPHDKFWKASLPAQRKTIDQSEEARRWPVHCFKSPWPFSEKYFMASYSFDSLVGEAGMNIPNQFGLYFCDVFGNRELIYRDSNISSLWARPLAPRTVPPRYLSTLPKRETAPNTGRYFIQNVYENSLGKFPDKVHSLRIVEVMLKTTPHANTPRVGKAHAAPGKKVLGTVPVEPDGSAAFEVPAETPLLFQLLDDKGRMIQGMRSLVYLQKGETASCTGCHEDRMSSAPSAITSASRKQTYSQIKPGPHGSNPLYYPEMIQPILDSRCVECHNQKKADGKIILTGEKSGNFTQSYNALIPFVSITYWGGPQNNLEPYSKPDTFGARPSKLTKILQGKDGQGHYGCKLTPEEWERFNTWMDVNALYRGSTDMP